MQRKVLRSCVYQKISHEHICETRTRSRKRTLVLPQVLMITNPNRPPAVSTMLNSTSGCLISYFKQNQKELAFLCLVYFIQHYVCEIRTCICHGLFTLLRLGSVHAHCRWCDGCIVRACSALADAAISPYWFPKSLYNLHSHQQNMITLHL